MDADFSPGKEAFQDPQMVKELEGDESLRAIAALVPYLNRVRQRLSREAEHAKEERKKQRREAFAQRRQQREQRLQHLRREQEIARRAFRQQQPFNLDFLPGGPGVVDGATSGDPRLMELEAEIAAELQRVAEDAAEEAAAEGEEEEDEEEELERLMEPEIGPDGKQRMALRVLVDTVLLKTYLMINIHMAMQMAKEPNFCDIEVRPTRQSQSQSQSPLLIWNGMLRTQCNFLLIFVLLVVLAFVVCRLSSCILERNRKAATSFVPTIATVS